jgi:hypothetical protein
MLVGVNPKPKLLLLLLLLLLSPRAAAPTGVGGGSAGGAGTTVGDSVAAAIDVVACGLDPSSRPSSASASGATADWLKAHALRLSDASVTSAPSTNVEWVTAELHQLTAGVVERLTAARACVAARMAGMSTELQWLVVGSTVVLAANFLGMSVG